MKKQLRVYVAGAYSDDNVGGVLRNIGRGQYWTTRLFDKGLAPFCPWLDKEFVFALWEKPVDVQKFYDYSMRWLEVSDAVFVVPNVEGMKNWEQSVGTKKEINRAIELQIPVFLTEEALLNYDPVDRYTYTLVNLSNGIG